MFPDGHPVTSAGRTESNNSFLINPETNKSLFLGEIQTKVDDKKIIRETPRERIESVSKLQRFSSDSWKEVKYSKTLQAFLAAPGFVELKINNELCHLNRGKDFLAQTERVMAGLTNALLDQKDLLRSGLQEIINWANNTDEVNPSNLFNKFISLFDSDSQNYKNMEQILQVLRKERNALK